MTRNFLLKAVVLLLMLPFIHACASGRILIRADDLSQVKARLEAGEKRQEAQLERIDRLLDGYEIQYQLMLQNVVDRMRYFEFLEDIVRDAHADTSHKLARLASLLDSEPANHLSIDTGFETISTDKLLVGEIEKVRLTPPGRVFHARIDTGATTSSLDARDIESFERDGGAWVRFKVAEHEDESLHELEKPVERYVRVLQSSSEQADRRPVVKLQFQLGLIEMIDEFTLVDRKHLDYQVLIGRNILKDLMVVDVAQQFVVPLPESESDENDTL